jgi:hypothetical protein
MAQPADNFVHTGIPVSMDSDTIFTTAVTHPEELFCYEEDVWKPRVIGISGPIVRHQTYSCNMITTKVANFKFVPGYPILIKTSHLKYIRDEMQKKTNETTFHRAYHGVVTHFLEILMAIILNSTLSSKFCSTPHS